MASYALFATLGISNAFLGLGIHNRLAWAVTAFWTGYVILMWQRSRRRSIVSIEPSTAVTFHETGVVVARGNASSVPAPQFFPFADIRSVRLTSDAIVLYGLWSVILIIPTAELADDVAQIMAYFEEHLVSKDMPQTAAGGVVTLRNSLWPVLARHSNTLTSLVVAE